ncbi:uncharacterized protein LOC115095902 [Rhinatrema bivittatum]|uniref:uncharacterized protein LOC115095902 n=1 Tax=Rhinatrema bivittatum TaxID=194408 RepID=UPI0011277A82|nr:uncharacterized protein LOC115095902 [Rhinatrema bivittatum]
MDSETCNLLATEVGKKMSAKGTDGLKQSTRDKEEPDFFAASLENNDESTTFQDTGKPEQQKGLGDEAKLLLLNERDLLAANEELKCIIQETKSPITTETDIDITAVLLPSGGTRSHPHTIKIAVSETVAPQPQNGEPVFSDGCFSTVEPQMEACGSHRFTPFIYQKPLPPSSKQKPYVIFPLPFSFGSNSKQAALQLEPSLGSCSYKKSDLENSDAQNYRVEKIQERNGPILFGIRQDKEILLEPKRDQSRAQETNSPETDLSSGSVLNDKEVPTVYCEFSKSQILYSEVTETYLLWKEELSSDLQTQSGPHLDTKETHHLSEEAHVCIPKGDSGTAFMTHTLNLEMNKTDEPQLFQRLDLVPCSTLENSNPQTVHNIPELLPLKNTRLGDILNPMLLNSVQEMEISFENINETGQDKEKMEASEYEEENQNTSTDLISSSHYTQAYKYLNNNLIGITTSAISLDNEREDALPGQKLETRLSVSSLHDQTLDPALQSKEFVECKISSIDATETTLSEDLQLESNESQEESAWCKDGDHQSRPENTEFDSTLSNSSFLSCKDEDVHLGEQRNPRPFMNAMRNQTPGSTSVDKEFHEIEISLDKKKENEVGEVQEKIRESFALKSKGNDPGRSKNADSLRIANCSSGLCVKKGNALKREQLNQAHALNELDKLTSEIFIKTSVQDVYGRIIKEHGLSFLEELRRTFLDDEDHRFTLLDSGLVLSKVVEHKDARIAFMTMQNGERLGMTISRPKLFLYYRLDIHFHITEQLNAEWFRVKDWVTQLSMLMKKVPVICDWRKLLKNFLFLPSHRLLLVPYAVIYDRSGFIYYLMEDRNVIAVGTPPKGHYLDRRKLLGEVLSFLRFCHWNGFYPEDIGNTVVYTIQGLCFDPSGLFNKEDSCAFRKIVKNTLASLLRNQQQDYLMLESVVDRTCQWLEEAEDCAAQHWMTRCPVFSWTRPLPFLISQFQNEMEENFRQLD